MNLHVPARPIIFDQTPLQFEPHAQKFNATAPGTLQGRSMTWRQAAPRRSNQMESRPATRAFRLKEKTLCGPRSARRTPQKKRLASILAASQTSLPARRAAARSIIQLGAPLTWLAACDDESNVHVSNALSGLQTTALEIARQEFREAGVHKQHELATSIVVRALDNYLRTTTPARTIDRNALDVALARVADKLATGQVRDQLRALSDAGGLNQASVAPIVSSIASKCFKPFMPPDGSDRSQAMSLARSLFIAEAGHALAYRKAVDLNPERYARGAEQQLFRGKIASHFSTLDTRDLQALVDVRPLEPHYAPVYAVRILQEAKGLAEARIFELRTQVHAEVDRLPQHLPLGGNAALEHLINRLSGIGATLAELRTRGAETIVDHQKIDDTLAALESAAHGETSHLAQLPTERLGTLITAVKQLNVKFTELPNLNAQRAKRYRALAATYMQAVAPAASQVTHASELATLMQTLNQHQYLADQADALRLDEGTSNSETRSEIAGKSETRTEVRGNGDTRGQALLRDRVMRLVLGSIQDPALRAMARHVDQVSMQHLRLR